MEDVIAALLFLGGIIGILTIVFVTAGWLAGLGLIFGLMIVAGLLAVT